VNWETERLYDGKLCQKYLYQKLLKSDKWFSSNSRKCRRYFFETQCRSYERVWFYAVLFQHDWIAEIIMVTRRKLT